MSHPLKIYFGFGFLFVPILFCSCVDQVAEVTVLCCSLKCIDKNSDVIFHLKIIRSSLIHKQFGRLPFKRKIEVDFHFFKMMLSSIFKKL
jgi:hypothetical protein